MPDAWSPEEDRNLLLTILEASQVNTSTIAKRWTEKYSNKPGKVRTERAIAERLKKLKGMAGGGTNGVSTPKKALAGSLTPKKAFTPKTPTTSAKKRKQAYLSDEDEEEAVDADDDEDVVTKEDLSLLTPRTKRERSSKKLKSYTELFHESDEEEDQEKTVEKVEENINVKSFEADDSDSSDYNPVV